MRTSRQPRRFGRFRPISRYVHDARAFHGVQITAPDTGHRTPLELDPAAYVSQGLPWLSKVHLMTHYSHPLLMFAKIL